MGGMRTWGRVLGVVLALCAAAMLPERAAAQEPVKATDGKVTVRLISEHAALIPGETNWLGVQYDLAPGWHIYWTGQNDSGAAPTITLSLPDGFAAGDLVWPAPVRYNSGGDILDHIYEKRVVILAPVKVPAGAKAETVTIGVNTEHMVCQESCRLGSADARLTIPVGAPGGKPERSPDARLFIASRERLPKPVPADNNGLITAAWKGSTLSITSHKAKKLAFYPAESSAKPENLLKGGSSDQGRLELTFEEPGHAAGIVEIWPESGGVRSTLLLLDLPAPEAKRESNKPSDRK